MIAKLIVFTIFECFILFLNVAFITLIYLYIRKFGLKVLDKYILTSFFLLAFALCMRSSINLANYTMGLEYVQLFPGGEDPDPNYQEKFSEWFHINHNLFEVDSIKCYLVAVILRNISIGINIARWFSTLSEADVAKLTQIDVKVKKEGEEEVGKQTMERRILIVLIVFISIESIIGIIMLAKFAVGKPVLNLTQFYIVSSLVCVCYSYIYYKLWKIFA